MSKVESNKKISCAEPPVGLSIDDFRLGMQCFFIIFVQALRSATCNQW